MKLFVDHLGRPLPTGTEIGAGGEGKVLALGPDQVVKLYTDKPSSVKQEKLAAMLAWQPRRTLRVSAWPLGTVHHGAGGPLIGVTMRRVAGVRLDFLTNTSERKALHPEIDWGFLVSVATNIAGALEEVHADGIVIGDLNPAGILVDPRTAQIALIDMDSVQFAGQSQRYTCDVGRPEYTAPELQRAGTLAGVWRLPTSDHFALAIIIFEILFLGRHPFIAKPLATTNVAEMPDAGTAIATRGYAYGRNRQHFGWELPERWPTPELLPPLIQELFEAAFGDDPAKRPDATAWHRALLQVVVPRLNRCAADRRHVHPVTVCPWCEYDRHGRYFFDPSLDAKITLAAVDLATLGAVLASLADHVRPHLAIAEAVVVPNPLPTPLAWALRRWAISIPVIGVVGMISVLALVFGAVGIGRFFAVVTGCFVGGPYVVRWWQRRRATREFEQATTAYERAVASWPPLLTAVMHDATAWSQAYSVIKALSDDIALSTQEALASIRETALRRHLEHHLLRGQRFPSIDGNDISQLAQQGITSAADLNPGSLSDMRSFGLQKTGALMSWRRECERTFVFEPSTPHIRSALQTQFTRQLEEVQSAIVGLRQQTATLRRTEISPVMRAQATVIVPLVARVAQATANREALNRASQ